jgi:hypothetical protein
MMTFLVYIEYQNIIEKIQYFSIHIWLKLLREYTLFQYDCIPSLTAVKMLAISINN